MASTISTTDSARVHEVSREDARRRLERRIWVYERRHELPSDQMLAALKSGERKETAEIAHWMVLYRTLLMLER